MKAIIRYGSQQYLVEEKSSIKVPNINDEKNLRFDILAIISEKGIQIGGPLVEGASLDVKIIGQGKTPKRYIYKYKSKTGYRRKIGHRDQYSVVQINSIKA